MEMLKHVFAMRSPHIDFAFKSYENGLEFLYFSLKSMPKPTTVVIHIIQATIFLL